MINELLKLSDALESAGLSKEADELDSFVRKIAQISDQEIQSIPENAPQKPAPVTQRQDYNKGQYFSKAELLDIMKQLGPTDEFQHAIMTNPFIWQLIQRLNKLEQIVGLRN
jgi:hypothetical protein